MPDYTRRGFLAGLAGAVVAATGLARHVVSDPSASVDLPSAVAGQRSPTGTSPTAAQRLDPPTPARVALPGGGVLDALPGQDNRLALTLDDGVNTDVVRMYTEFAKDSGIRLTYFVNGIYPSWTDNRKLLEPLVASGQIQLANHTWSHPDLTKASPSQLAYELTRNDRFLVHTYGVDAKPYLRPPYGKHNRAVRSAAADLGYTAITLWDGSLSDATVVTEEYIAAMADKYFLPQSIVVGHLNHLPVTHVYDKLLEVIHARNLRTVTLDDVFTRTR